MLAVLALVFVAAFVLVVRFYNVEGGSTVTGGVALSTESGLLVTMQPVSVDATRNLGRMHFSFAPQGNGFVGSDTRLTRNLRVTIATGQGLAEFKYPAGTVLGQAEAEVALDGEQANYPFDEHDGLAFVSADGYEKDSDGAIVSSGAIPVGLQAEGGVNGWDTDFNLSDGMTSRGLASISYSRAFSTQVFALVILTIAGVLALLALAVGMLVESGRRPAEAALLSWSAALLFALPAMRSYLPNGPPIGASIDIYAFLWFMVAAGFGAVLLILGWSAQRVDTMKHDRHRTPVKEQVHGA